MSIQTTLHGRIGKIETKKWNDKSYTSVSIAVNKGPNKPEPQWVEGTIWGQEHQDRVKNYGQGDHVLVQGNLSIDEFFSKKESKEKLAIRLRIQNICLLKRKQEQATKTKTSNYY